MKNTENLYDEITVNHRYREDFLRAETRLVLQVKSICRRYCDGDKEAGTDLYKEVLKLYRAVPDERKNDGPWIGLTRGPVAGATVYLLPFLSALLPLKSRRLTYERVLKKLAKQLPVWPWAEELYGFGPLGLGQIVGECGNLSNYPNPACVWKRLGLAVMEGGERQHKTKDKKKAILMGYSPRRRSVMFVIGDSLLKKPNEYKELYDKRKAYEQGKLPAPKGKPIIWHRRAHRYVEKRLLRDLWRAWNPELATANPEVFQQAA